MEYTTKANMKKPGYDDPVDIQDINDNFDTVDGHIGASLVSEDGVHGLRFNTQDEVLEVYNENTGAWEEVAGGGGGGIAPLDVSGVTVDVGNGRVYLKWSDPADTEIQGTVVCQWGGTKLVRKAGSYPTGVKDGVLVLDNTVRDAYKTTAFTDSGLTNGTTYYYQFFPYSTAKTVNVNEVNRISAAPNRKKIGDIPSQSGTLTYNGKTQTPSWTGYDSNKMTIGGVTSSTDAGSYTATFTPLDDYCWSDGTTAAKSVQWTIARQSTAVPAQNGTLTYNGGSQTPSWTGYDSNKMTLGGTNAGTNAGSYNATFTIGANYIWSDGTTSVKTVAWKINKKAGSLSISPTSITLNLDKKTATIAVTREGNGAISAVSSNTGVATASVSGTTVTVSHVNQTNGSATITVKVAEGTNHLAPANKTCAVTATFIVSTLNDNSWAAIHSVSANGANYWSVGDRKSVLVKGTVGTLSVNATYWVYILGFNHNSTKEGTGIHFGGFKTAQTGGTDICLVDSKYNTDVNNGSKLFNMNHWGSSSSPYNTNYGGWAACDIRYDILGSTDKAPTPYGSTKTTSATGQDPSAACATNPVANTLMAALPADLRAVMQPMTKYTDNKGNSSNVAANVTKTIDYLPLLSEFEIFGARSYANQYEKDYQAQYAYYSAGNSKVKYRHSSTGSTAFWWERSPRYSGSYTFCRVNTNGAANLDSSDYSYGLAPAFKI